MGPNDIKHFLVIYDVQAGHSEVRQFGGDYDAAQEAYEQVEVGMVVARSGWCGGSGRTDKYVTRWGEPAGATSGES